MSTRQVITRRLIKGLCAAACLVGIALVAYPILSNTLYAQQQAQASVSYENTVLNSEEEQRLANMRVSAQSYNDTLSSIDQSRFELLAGRMSALASNEQKRAETITETTIQGTLTTQPDLNQLLLNYPNLLKVNAEGIIATIDIPSIKAQLPIYLGTSNETLSKGVGHLEGTSLPLGGKGSHCVLTAHTGLISKELFTNIDSLKQGDQFTLTTINGSLLYQVDQISIIEPSDTSALAIESDQDYVTLVTCTPQGLNTHRLLVRGTRIETPEATLFPNASLEASSSPLTLTGKWRDDYLQALGIAGAFVGIATLSVGTYILIKRQRKKTKR